MAKKKEQIIVIPKPDYRFVEFRIVSDTGINIHRLGKKLQAEFEDRDQNKPRPKKGSRDIQAEFLDSLYCIDANGKEIDTPKKLTAKTRYGFPASGFKKAMVFAARQFANIKMSEIRGRFFVLPLHKGFVEINGKPEIDRFWRRIGGKGPGTGTPDRGTRATFPKWAATIRIKYVANLISAESIAHLLSTAGFSVGCGEDRPDKTGNTGGMWHVG